MLIQAELVDVPTKKEYIVAVLLENKSINEEFGRWPLHITIVPWFEIKNSTKAINAIKRVSKYHKPFSVIVGEKAMFGPKHTVEVNRLAEDQPLKTLHEALTHELNVAGANFMHKHYMGNGYNPHITKRSFANVQPGHTLNIKNVYLIEAPIGNRLTRIKKVVGIGNLK